VDDQTPDAERACGMDDPLDRHARHGSSGANE
jgi:hypothetical protein